MAERERRMVVPDTAVVLVSLGTPQSPTPDAVRRYLREFLSDRRIVTMPPAVWRPILELFVLPVRGRKSAAKYASVWTAQGSPLMVHSLAQRDALAERLGDGVRVALAMRYGEPSFASVLNGLAADGVRHVLVVPMYPQFSTTTVATVTDALTRYQRSHEGLFDVRVVQPWFDDPGYIAAAARRIEETWAEKGRPDFAHGDKLLLSFHGIPVAAVRNGDRYPTECEATTRLLRERLGLTPDECLMTYQSKFGPAAWLTPATIATVADLADRGAKRLDVFCPGFAADCLETDEEIGMLNRDAFMAHGGEAFVRVPCVNDFGPWMDAFEAIVRRGLAG